MRKAGILFLMALAFLSCGTSKQSTTSNNSEDTALTKPIGGGKDAHGCLVAAGQTWSKLKEGCIQVFNMGLRLNPVNPIKGKVTFSSFVIFNKDASKAEIFVPWSKDSYVLPKMTQKFIYQKGVYKFDAYLNKLYIHNKEAFKAEKDTTSGWPPAMHISGIYHNAMYMLKAGFDSVHASTMVTKGQLMFRRMFGLMIADGRRINIPFNFLVKVDTPCFKFTFSKTQFYPTHLDPDTNYADDLAGKAKQHGWDLYKIITGIKHKDPKAMHRYWKLGDDIDGASAEAWIPAFWQLINLWSDKELSSFIAALPPSDRSDFCAVLMSTAWWNPIQYYTLYYPLVMQQIKKSGVSLSRYLPKKMPPITNVAPPHPDLRRSK